MLAKTFLNSLVGRFTLASVILLPVFIALCATILINSFAHSQLRGEQETLQAHMYLLLTLAEVEKQHIILPEALPEPRFNQIDSGLYAFVIDENGKKLWRSSSALMLKEGYENSGKFVKGQKNFQQISLDTLTLNQLHYDIEWVDEKENKTALRFIITSDNSHLTAELNSYQTRLWQWLGFMGLLMITGQMLIMHWGLQPLNKLSKQLTELQNNRIQQLDNNYPKEIQPITKNFNEILSQEKQQRERYRNTMSDLAHSLKTPLAVIQSQLEESGNQQQLLYEQLDRINQIISHQLRRATIRVNQNTIATHATKVSIQTLINRLIKILDKAYQEKNIQFDNHVANDHYFFGDESDLLEVMGNLLDNACKYGNGQVRVFAMEKQVADQHELSICISDNGKGIPDSLKNTLLARGARGDTANAGQGIGLSVAVDIISSYGGSITVKTNAGKPHLSGACFCVGFPVFTKAN